MQLEKVHSAEAGLAGWISSNDVTLFTMVLVVVIALFLHTKLIKGTSENEQLTKEKAELAALKQKVEGDLESTKQDLAQTEGTLHAAREEKATLNAQLEERKRLLRETEQALENLQDQSGKLKVELNDALALIGRLETDKKNLLTDKSGLESEQARLLAAKVVLETDKEKLSQLRDTLAKEKITLSEKMAALTVQLNEKVNALQDAEAYRDRLKVQADNLDAIVATLQKKLNLASTDMAKLKSESGATIAQIQEQADAEKAKAEDYLSRLRRAAELFKGLQADKQNLKSQVTDLEDRYEQQVAREATISRELVGVKGGLRRVAFLFDASGSMKERGTGEGDRWLEAQKIASTWLAHLDVDECVLVVFSTRVGTYPSDGSLLRVSGPDGAANRDLMLKQLSAVEPRGVTNTLDALRTAYQYEGLDTIVLFSDGAPTNSTSGQFDPYIAQQIYALCRQHPDIPINTIGLGNYFDQNMSTFLRNLARLTGGTFRGR